MESSSGGQVYFISEVQPAATGKLSYKLISKNESYKQLKETAIRHNCAESELICVSINTDQIRGKVGPDPSDK